MWGQMNIITRKHTGEYFQTESGETGEAVRWCSWGGVDLLFETGSIATCAMGDLVRAERPDNAAQFEQFVFDKTGQVIKKTSPRRRFAGRRQANERR